MADSRSCEIGSCTRFASELARKDKAVSGCRRSWLAEAVIRDRTRAIVSAAASACFPDSWMPASPGSGSAVFNPCQLATLPCPSSSGSAWIKNRRAVPSAAISRHSFSKTCRAARAVRQSLNELPEIVGMDQSRPALDQHVLARAPGEVAPAAVAVFQASVGVRDPQMRRDAACDELFRQVGRVSIHRQCPLLSDALLFRSAAQFGFVLDHPQSALNPVLHVHLPERVVYVEPDGDVRNSQYAGDLLVAVAKLDVAA